MNALQYLGPVPLFLGTETATWGLADFETAARSAKALGVTSLLIKIADGVLIWYSGIGGWQHVLDTVKAILPAIPYTYCYGNAFGALSNEIDILAAAMRYSGIAVADMEIPWNGRADWGAQVTAALGPVPGIFGVTTWADPEKQNWRDVISARCRTSAASTPRDATASPSTSAATEPTPPRPCRSASPSSGPTLRSSTTVSGAGRAPARNSTERSLADAAVKLPLI